MYKEPNRLYDIKVSRVNIRKYKSIGFSCSIDDVVQATIQNLIDFGSIIKIDLICDACGLEFQRQARQIKERAASNKHCNKCSNQIHNCKDKSHVGKSKQEIKDIKDLEKYGQTGLNKEDKIAKTNLKLYGSENVFGSKIIQDRIKETNLERYGAENPFSSPVILDKIAKTNLERYGVENPFAAESVKETIKETKLARYGDEKYVNLGKAKQTNLERYGVEYTFQREDIKKTIAESYQKYVNSQEFYDFRLNLREEKGWGEFREDTSDWEKYKFLVWGFTNRNELNLLENYEKRSLAGVDGGYQLDHKVSMKFGFENSIDPEIIGHINNLEFIPWEENLSKGTKCSITLEELLNTIKDLI